MVYGFYGYSSEGVDLRRSQQDTEIVFLVDVQYARLKLAILAFGQHIEEIGEEVFGQIRSLSNGHGQTYGYATITDIVCETVVSAIVLLQKTGFYIMNKNLTLSHRSTVLR